MKCYSFLYRNIYNCNETFRIKIKKETREVLQICN